MLTLNIFFKTAVDEFVFSQNFYMIFGIINNQIGYKDGTLPALPYLLKCLKWVMKVRKKNPLIKSFFSYNFNLLKYFNVY